MISPTANAMCGLMRLPLYSLLDIPAEYPESIEHVKRLCINDGTAWDDGTIDLLRKEYGGKIPPNMSNPDYDDLLRMVEVYIDVRLDRDKREYR